MHAYMKIHVTGVFELFLCIVSYVLSEIYYFLYLTLNMLKTKIEYVNMHRIQYVYTKHMEIIPCQVSNSTAFKQMD